MNLLLSSARLLKSVLCSLLLFSGIAYSDNVLSDNALSENGAVILQYHHVSDATPRSTSVSPDVFEEHLDYLHDNGFAVKSIVDVVEAIRNKEPLPDKTVVITFDDAYRNIYENAYPILKQRGFPFTIFVNTEAVDRNFGQYLSWEQLREMGKNGATIANHSITHAHMVVRKPGETQQAWIDRNRDEILNAEAQIKEKTGQSVKLFAWPFGEANPPLQQLLTDLGFTGFGQQSGVASVYSDLTMIPRYPMAASYADMRSFRLKANSLPLPVTNQQPLSAMVSSDNLTPALTLELAKGQYQKNQINCYASNSGKVPVQWQDDAKTRFTTVTDKPLSVGRSRYNCTAPSMDGKRYYWFSHQWLRFKDDGTAID